MIPVIAPINDKGGWISPLPSPGLEANTSEFVLKSFNVKFFLAMPTPWNSVEFEAATAIAAFKQLLDFILQISIVKDLPAMAIE